MQTAFKKIRDQEYLSNQGNYKTISKIFDYTFYKPDLKSLKYAKSEKSHPKRKELEALKIENLCKFLSYDEIELVSRKTFSCLQGLGL